MRKPWPPLTQAGCPPLCDCCSRPLRPADVDEDGYTLPADCCGRVALCEACRRPGEHECDPEDAR